MRTQRKPLKRTPPPPAQQKQNGKIMAINTPSLGRTFMEGISLGTGSALGHRMMDIVFGPRNVQVSVPSSNPVSSNNEDLCKSIKEKYEMCLLNNISNCNDLSDLMIKYNCN